MSSKPLQHILNTRQTDIFSSISTESAIAHPLRELQDTTFSCLLSFLEDKDSQSLETAMASTAKQTAADHGLAEQLMALEKLEMAVLEFSRNSLTDQASPAKLLEITGFFCNARQIIIDLYPRDYDASADSAASAAQGGTRSIRMFGEVMHKILDPSLGPEEVLKTICGSVLKMTLADVVTIFLIDRETGAFTLKQIKGGRAFKDVGQEKAAELINKFEVAPERESNSIKGLFDVALSKKRPIFSSDIRNDPRVNMPEILSELGIRALLVAPMFESGKEFGFMSVGFVSTHEFYKEEIEGLGLFADQAAVAWRNAELYRGLQRSEQRYRDLIENAIDVIFILDTEGKFVSINKQAEEITGHKAEEWIGRNFSDLVDPNDLPAVMDGWSRGMRGDNDLMPVTIKNAKGEDVHLEINSSLIEEDGELTGMMCIARDATLETTREKEFIKLHESVVDTNRKLEESMTKLKETQVKLIQSEKLSAMGELISGIAHELNNPLTGIMGYSQLLLESTTDPKRRSSLEKVNHAAFRCKRIVQNLLEFARHHKPSKKIININTVIQSVIELREYQIRSDDIAIIISLSESEAQLFGDFHQLQQVILNIINNAHQAIVAEGIGNKIEIQTRKDRKNNCLHVLISNNGLEISSENLSKIFDPFFTTKEVGQGTGLGLSVAYGIVQEHGGQISVESEPGKGTIFKIRFPLAEIQPEFEKSKSEIN